MNCFFRPWLPLLAVLCFAQAGCVSVTPKLQVPASLDITVPKSWRPLFDADLSSATEAAIIRHYARHPENPKIILAIANGAISESKRDFMVIDTWVHLMSDRVLVIAPVFSTGLNNRSAEGDAIITIRFE
jgi:hypothetical protein